MLSMDDLLPPGVNITDQFFFRANLLVLLLAVTFGPPIAWFLRRQREHQHKDFNTQHEALELESLTEDKLGSQAILLSKK